MAKCCICNKEINVYKEKVHYRPTDQEPLCNSCNQLDKSAIHAANQPKPRGVEFCRNCGFELLGKEDLEAIEQGQPTGRAIHLSKDEPSMGFAFLGIFIPLLGLILYMAWKDDYPKKASSCIKGAGLGVVVGFIITFMRQSLYRY